MYRSLLCLSYPISWLTNSRPSLTYSAVALSEVTYGADSCIIFRSSSWQYFSSWRRSLFGGDEGRDVEVQDFEALFLLFSSGSM